MSHEHESPFPLTEDMPLSDRADLMLLRSESAHMKTRIYALESDNESLRSRISELDDAWRTGHVEAKDLHSQLAEMERGRDHYHAELMSAQTRIARLTDKISVMERAAIDSRHIWETDKTNLESKVKELHARIQELEEGDCEFRLALDATSTERDRFAVQLGEERAATKALAAEKARLDFDLAASKEAIAKLQDKLEGAIAQGLAHKDRADELQESKDYAQKRVQELSLAIADLQRINHDLNRDLDVARNKPDGSERVQALEAHIKQKQEDYRHVCEELRIAHATADALLRAIQAISQWQTTRK